MSKQTRFSEKVAEGAAEVFLKENIGSEIFIGADIESLIAKNAQVVYQNIDDPSFFGALVAYKSKQFVVLNTHQDLRARYYSAAHEMWHLALASAMFGEQSEVIKHSAAAPNFDSERAADHFAAALMLPQATVVKIWNKYVQNQEVPTERVTKELVVRMANLAAMPYVAVCRRLSELGLPVQRTIVNWDKQRWQLYLEQSEFPPSPLDEAVGFEKFAGLSEFVKNQVDHKQMTLMAAANFLTHADPNQATQYLKQRKEKIDRLEVADD